MNRLYRRRYFLAEAISLLIALSCVVYVGSNAVVACSSRQQASALIHGVRSQSEYKEAQNLNRPNAAKLLGVSGVIGNLEIPALKLAVPILSDFEPSSLRRGVGHLAGTALPGGLGTMALAGHRDTYFRPLKAIKKSMDIRVAGKTGVYHYSVDSTEVVLPDEVRVLDIGSQPELVLITCYPFDYVGAAPQRFIVHAHLLSAIPDNL